MSQYIVTRSECQKKCMDKCCLRCGGELSPIETVDNARNPTFWCGCMKCLIFSPGTSARVFSIAREIQNQYKNITMDDMCHIVNSILSLKEVDDGNS